MQQRYVLARNIPHKCTVCNCRIAGIALTSVKRVGEKMYRILCTDLNFHQIVLFPILTVTTLSRMVEVRVTTRAFWSASLRDPSSVIVTLYSTSGRKILQSVTQTPASARISAWIKSGGNRSHISVGRYIWTEFQDEEVPLSVTGTHRTRNTSLLWFPVGRSIVRQGLIRNGS